MRFTRTAPQQKTPFFPRVSKTQLFEQGYIAENSSHSRGSTVDVSLIPLSEVKNHEHFSYVNCTPKKVSSDFETGVDCLDPDAYTLAPTISKQALINCLFLVTLMEKYGFKNYAKEWWHFTLIDEPFPNNYFNFPVI